MIYTQFALTHSQKYTINFVKKLSDICHDIFSTLTQDNDVLDLTEYYDIDKAIKVTDGIITIAHKYAYSTAQILDNSISVMDLTNPYR